MTEEQYLEFLKTAPEHDSDEFLRFLIDNNVVVWHFEDWLVIENKKYHNDQTEWHTAFWFGKKGYPNFDFMHTVYKDYEWIKKRADKQTVKRFHIHLTRPQPHLSQEKKVVVGRDIEEVVLEEKPKVAEVKYEWGE